MSIFIPAISCLTTSNLTLIHGSNIPGSYAILFFTTLDFTSITSHIHNWTLFLLCLISSFFLEFSPLISSSILGTYQPGKFLFQCPIFLPFHTVHGVLKVRILKWFAIPSPVDHILSELCNMIRPSWWPYMAWVIVSLS